MVDQAEKWRKQLDEMFDLPDVRKCDLCLGTGEIQVRVPLQPATYRTTNCIQCLERKLMERFS